jgi:glucose/arabinose dehydrogenase
VHNSHIRFMPALAVLLALSCACKTERPLAEGVELDKIKLPPGFEVSLYSNRVPGARAMALGDKGTLFVGTRREGRVYAVLGHDRNEEGDRVLVVAQGLFLPNGVAFRDGSLYVAEAFRVLRYDNIETRLDHPPPPVVINDSFPHESPGEEGHLWKFIRFGPDGKLYVSVGAPCDTCEPNDERSATIMRMNADGSGLEVFARGIRSSVGFDWDPTTSELWFTENGPDKFGQNIPPDELNRAPYKGLDFGFPSCFGSIPDPIFAGNRTCREFASQEVELGPHVAPLGLAFYTGKMFPEEYRNQIFVAEHGSANRTIPIGYRLTLVRVENDRPIEQKVFAEGWLQGDRAWGRPVDVLVRNDGALLVSDDKAGAIYRISYQK